MHTSILKPQLENSKFENIVVASILAYITLQSVFNFIERYTFWGEMFTLVALFSILKIRYNSSSLQKPLLFLVCLWVLFFPAYGLFVSLLSANSEFNSIFYFRHLSYFYYAVFSFFAFKYAPNIIYILNKIRLPFFLCVLYFVFLVGTSGVTYSITLSFLLIALGGKKGGETIFYLGLVFVMATILIFGSGAGTNKFILALYVAFVTLNALASFVTRYLPQKFIRLLIILGILATLIFFIRYISFYNNMTTQLALLGQNISALDQVSHEQHTDLSGFWRIVLWSHLYGRFLEHPWGLGLGTPLFSAWLDGFVALHLDRPGENYVQGAHNSFITFIARLGIPGLLYFLSLFYYIAHSSLIAFRRLKFKPFKTPAGRILSGVFLALISMCISASFNVALESPLYAGAFWFCLGLFIRLFGDIDETLKTMNSLDDAEYCT